ncbi:hypothetical protein CBS9595_002346 [Malassezia furfur]|nr:hypothetical protein CBS9595_002346 [Malassezia furfur]
MERLHDPILAVSRAKLASLNTDDVEQVARFWNVFTKCKEALEDGQRFENLSWRLWFRQSHGMHRRASADTPASTPPPLASPEAPNGKLAGGARVPTPLSEPELSTDESASSEDGHSEAPAPDTDAAPSSNAFTAVIPAPGADAPWNERIASLAREARARRTKAVPRVPDGTHEAVRDAFLRGTTSTPSHATSLSTTGTLTPRAQSHRSRSSSSSGSDGTAPAQDTSAPETPAPLARDADATATPSYPHALETSQVPSSTGTEWTSQTPTPRARSPRAAPAQISPTSGNTMTYAPPAAPSAPPEPAPSGPVLPEPAPPARAEARLQAQQRSATTTLLAGARARRGQSARQQRSQERLALRTAAKGSGGATRAQLMQMLTMTHAEPAEEKPAPKPKKKRAPIKFTTGAEDNSEDEENKAAPAPARDDDEWCEVDEEEEKRLRAAERAEARRKRREAEERERIEMFKKRPIRSMSLADLSSAKKPADAAPAPAPAPDGEQGHPTRGLLSTLFHAPAEMRRGSVAAPGVAGALRAPSARPRHPLSGKTMSLAALPARAGADAEARNTSTPTLSTETPALRRNSSMAHTPLASRSKSAIALPLLNLTSLRSTTGRSGIDVRRMPSTTSLVSGGSVGSEEDGTSTPREVHATMAPPERVKSSTALARLAALAHRGPDTASHTDLRASLGSVLTPGEPERQRSDTSMSRTSSQTWSPSEEDGPSLAVQVDQDAPEDYFNLKRVPQATPPQTRPQSPVSPRQTQSMTELPIPAPTLQSPRTLRRNMLRDELSESLRENLLWERQSRARLLGLGVPPSEDSSGSSTPVAPRRSVSQAGPTSTTELRRYDEQSFHHKGW